MHVMVNSQCMPHGTSITLFCPQFLPAANQYRLVAAFRPSSWKLLEMVAVRDQRSMGKWVFVDLDINSDQYVHLWPDVTRLQRSITTIEAIIAEVHDLNSDHCDHL